MTPSFFDAYRTAHRALARTHAPRTTRARTDNMIHVLGIDAGGTKTVCQLADEEGNVLAEARGGGANLQAVGELELEKVLHQVMEEAIGDRSVVPSVICLGIAGVDRPDDATIVRAIMKRIGYKAKVIVVNDALVALEAGAPAAAGCRHHLRHRVDLVRTQRARGGGTVRRLGIRARRRGERLLDRPQRAARGVASKPTSAGQKTVLTPDAARALRRRPGPGPHPRGLPHESEARGNWRARAVRAGARICRVTRRPSASCARRPMSSSLRAMSVARRLGLVGQAFPFILAGGIFRAVPVARAGTDAPSPGGRARGRQCGCSIGNRRRGAIALALQEAPGGVTIPRYKAD